MKYVFSPLFVVILLMAAVASAYVGAQPFPLDDHFAYQRFIEALAAGRLDLSISGFHGSDFLAVLLHFVFPSAISQIHFQVFAAILLPLCAYAAARVLFQKEFERVLFTVALSLMPFVLFVSLRGWTGAAYWDLMLLSLAAAPVWPYVGAVLLALAVLTKPFALALVPLFFVLQSKNYSLRRKISPVLLLGGIISFYMAVQYFQAGQLIVGSHAELDQFNVWQGPVRIVLNAAHTLQIIFSVHNYYFPNPALTGPGNMMHTTPVLVFLGLWSLFTVAWPRPLHRALYLGVVVGWGLNLLLDHMDHFYMEAGLLCLIIAAMPVLRKHWLWIPLVLATLHFQWFYFYLEYGSLFSLGWNFFAIPALVDLLFLGLCVHQRRRVYVTLREIL